jgi:hypothetical protein
MRGIWIDAPELPPVTGDVAALSIFANVFPPAVMTDAVCDLLETSTLKIATPTMAIAIVTAASTSEFI